MGPLIQSCGWHSDNLRFTLWEFRSFRGFVLSELNDGFGTFDSN
jgi:hypothetical protein